jgi:hypothetical protein
MSVVSTGTQFQKLSLKRYATEVSQVFLLDIWPIRGPLLTSVADPGCLSRIPDPTFFHPGSRILIKEFKYFNPKKSKKWFLSSKNYEPGCSSRIPDPDADFLPSRIPDPGVKKAPNPGSRIRIRNTAPHTTHRAIWYHSIF